jgi:hypothetical protein
MPAPDLTDFNLTVRQVLTRDTETDEEVIQWRVESENLRRPRGGDTAQEALQQFVDDLNADDPDFEVNVEELQVEDDPLDEEWVEAE